MNFIDVLSKRLLAPPKTGKQAIIIGAILVSIPTLLRLAMDDALSFLPFIMYFPFLLMAALLISWRYAAAFSAISWLVANYLFMVPRGQTPWDASALVGLVVFLTSSALVIGTVQAARTIVENSLRPGRPEGIPCEVVFSAEGGQAWVSWYGSHTWVRLGPEDDVAQMMEDFLAQREVAERLLRSTDQGFGR